MTNWSPPPTADDYSLVDLDTYVEELEATGYFRDSNEDEAGEKDGAGNDYAEDAGAEDADETEGDAE